MRMFLGSQTAVQLFEVSSSALVGEAPATVAEVNFTPARMQDVAAAVDEAGVAVQRGARDLDPFGADAAEERGGVQGADALGKGAQAEEVGGVDLAAGGAGAHGQGVIDHHPAALEGAQAGLALAVGDVVNEVALAQGRFGGRVHGHGDQLVGPVAQLGAGVHEGGADEFGGVGGPGSAFGVDGQEVAGHGGVGEHAFEAGDDDALVGAGPGTGQRGWRWLCMGSSPARALASWLTEKTWASLWMRAMSWPEVILLTVSAAASLRIWRVAERSFQKGMLTSRPPPLARSSKTGEDSTMPHWTKAASSAVRSMVYCSKSVGTMMSVIAVFAIGF